jgi:Uma2 family endonuclease
MDSLIETLGLQETHELIHETEDKAVYAHTIYYEIEKIDYDNFVTEDDTPVDNLYSETQQRLYIDPLRSNKWTDRDFMACSNVAIYYKSNVPPVVPDMFLSFDVRKPDSWFEKKNRCYFTWVMKKPPELIVEIVSNKEGNENTTKFDIYATIGVKYYIIHDPYHELFEQDLNFFVLENGKYKEIDTLEPHNYLPDITLGLKIWKGMYEDAEAPFARWCDAEGKCLLTGAERSEAEAKRAAEAEIKAQEAEIKAQEAEIKAQEEAERARLAEEKIEEEAERTKIAEIKAQEEAERSKLLEAKIKEMEEKLAKMGVSLEI